MAEPTMEERISRLEKAQVVIAQELDRLEKVVKDLEASIDRG